MIPGFRRQVRRPSVRGLGSRSDIANLHEELGALAAQVAQQRAASEAILDAVEALRRSLDGEIHGMLRALVAEYARNQRALFALRETDAYEQAFVRDQPLVTITICTRPGRSDLLSQRAIPSALTQAYEPVEVVVVSDAAGAETQAAVEQFGDPRIRFFEQTHQVVHDDPWIHFLAGQQMSRNYAHARARGDWVLDLDDDDALRAHAAGDLLDLARRQRAEVSYGVIEQHAPDGTAIHQGAFPPAPREPDWRQRGLRYQPWDGCAGSGSLSHVGLTRIFAREWVASILAVPGDYFLLERMVRAGVRFAMLDRVVYDYYPATLWAGRAER